MMQACHDFNYLHCVPTHSTQPGWLYVSTSGCENPKPCQTELTVLEYGLYDGDPVTKVLLQPLTGNNTHLLLFI